MTGRRNPLRVCVNASGRGSRSGYLPIELRSSCSAFGQLQSRWRGASERLVWVASGTSAYAPIFIALVRVSLASSAWAGEETDDWTLSTRSATKGRPAWNAGRKLGAKRALKPQQVWAIRFWLDRERAHARPGNVRPRHRQQAARLRHRQAQDRRPRQRRVASVGAAHRHSNARPVDQCNSNCSNPLVPASRMAGEARGGTLNDYAFRAGSTASRTSAPGSMRAWLMVGHGHRASKRGLRNPLLRRTKGR